MGVKALVTGVSTYFIEGAEKLDFCKNDIIRMKEALNQGLRINRKNIYTLGESGIVNCEDFVRSISKIANNIKEDDIMIFYFSGHGEKNYDKHYLVFSDGLLGTDEIIDYFEKIKCKSKIIFLDTCFSGAFSPDQSLEFKINETMDQFVGKGYAVFASSNSKQYSHLNPFANMSEFTFALCSALCDDSIIREGKKSLYDIKELVTKYLRNWNKNNPEKNKIVYLGLKWVVQYILM